MSKSIRSLNLSKRVIELLEKKAKQDDRSVSWVANKILSEVLEGK